MKFDKNFYTGLIRRPLLTENKKVGENYSLTSRFYKVAGLDEERH